MAKKNKKNGTKSTGLCFSKNTISDVVRDKNTGEIVEFKNEVPMPHD